MLAALGELRLGLRDADLVQLKPGEQLLQQSSWVLLKGTLKTKGLAAKVPAGMPGAHLCTFTRVGLSGLLSAGTITAHKLCRLEGFHAPKRLLQQAKVFHLAQQALENSPGLHCPASAIGKVFACLQD